MFTKPVYYTSVHKTSLLKQCTKNQITVQVYTKAVYYTSIHKTSLLSGHKTSLLCKCTKRLDRERDRQTDFNINNERNVQGQNITKDLEITGMEHYTGSGNYRDRTNDREITGTDYYT